MIVPVTLDGFERTTFSHNGLDRDVYRAGTGPAVVIMRAEQLDGDAPDGVRRPANLEDAFVMLTGEQIE